MSPQAFRKIYDSHRKCPIILMHQEGLKFFKVSSNSKNFNPPKKKGKSAIERSSILYLKKKAVQFQTTKKCNALLRCAIGPQNVQFVRAIVNLCLLPCNFRAINQLFFIYKKVVLIFDHSYEHNSISSEKPSFLRCSTTGDDFRDEDAVVAFNVLVAYAASD